MNLKKLVLSIMVMFALGFGVNLSAEDFSESRRLMPKRPGHSKSPLPCGKCHMAEKEYSHLMPKIPRVNDILYLEECGSCHLAYQPELLPKASWKKLMGDLENHFGDDVQLTPNKHYALSRFIYKKAGGEQTYRSKQIMASLKSATPIRITEIPYIKELHKTVNKDLFKRKTIRSFANCEACHLSADGGLYYPKHIHVPEG